MVTLPVAANTVFPWEHTSYDFRKVLNIKDMMIVCCAAILEMIYISDVVQYPEEYMRKQALDIFKGYFKPYIDEFQRDRNRMDSRMNIRRLNLSFDIDFSPEICWVNPHAWFSANHTNHSICRLPRHTENADISKKTCNTVKNGAMYGVPFTTDMAKKIYAYYSKMIISATSKMMFKFHTTIFSIGDQRNFPGLSAGQASELALTSTPTLCKRRYCQIVE